MPQTKEEKKQYDKNKYDKKVISKCINDMINDLEIEQYTDNKFLYDLQQEYWYAKEYNLTDPRSLKVLEMYSVFD